ncbi:PhoD-like phosphatase N-terminal domain-containing protein [Sphingopyxis sp.]|uniref:PhoD-like phosphatase N-terminal domain-containing protein n=1 Tax=Sphingopyxis sp. TaxID=1908224 RepID=UPI0026008864|nr:PhoD-like phosphatase N-terminal domain-containing protein [Sphingopyxis sp.]MBK6413983.1 PhoD-like phosphatase N-terminal domain-containing protein [Sphingopyxis sp.]
MDASLETATRHHAEGERDHCAKIVVDGLQPGRWYFHRFIAPDGTRSVTGRTQTLPTSPASAFTIALFSCSNLPFGWFNAYVHAAAGTTSTSSRASATISMNRGRPLSRAARHVAWPRYPADAGRLSRFRGLSTPLRRLSPSDPDLQRLPSCSK